MTSLSTNPFSRPPLTRRFCEFCTMRLSDTEGTEGVERENNWIEENTHEIILLEKKWDTFLLGIYEDATFVFVFRFLNVKGPIGFLSLPIPSLLVIYQCDFRGQYTSVCIPPVLLRKTFRSTAVHFLPYEKVLNPPSIRKYWGVNWRNIDH